MQKHWMEWGPPAYIPVAGYFKLGKGAKKSSRKKASEVPAGTPGGKQAEILSREGKGDLSELFSLFSGGVIR